MRNEIHVFHWTVNPKLDDNSSVAVEARFIMGLRPEIEDVRRLVAAGTVVFEKVAIVKTPDLDIAWERTNSIDNAWYENGGDHMQVLKSPCRSSMMGDVLVHVEGERISGYITAAFGFHPLQSIDEFGIKV